MSILSRHEIEIRVLLTAIGVIGGIFLHPAVPLICIVLLSFAYRSFEAILLGLFVDFAWQPVAYMEPMPYFTLGAILVVWLLEPIRMQLLR